MRLAHRHTCRFLNKLEGAGQTITCLSRSDWTGTFPKAPVVLSLTDSMVAEMTGLKEYEILPTDREMPTMGRSGSMTLAQMIGKDFDDPAWQDLLNQVTYEEMALLIGVGYHSTKSVASVTKPRTVDENGPQGFTKRLTDVFGHDRLHRREHHGRLQRIRRMHLCAPPTPTTPWRRPAA